MDDVLRRLGSLEKDVSVIKTDVGAIIALIPHLATKADVALIPHLATKAEVALIPHLATKADVSDAVTSVIKWIVGTTIAVAALAFSIAKFVH